MHIHVCSRILHIYGLCYKIWDSYIASHTIERCEFSRVIHGHCIIGASLSGPHTSGTVLCNPLVYIYICIVHTSPPGSTLQANVTGSMTSFNNSTWQSGWFRLLAAPSYSFYTHLMKLRKGNLTVRPV